MENYYELLEVNSSASFEEIKSSYRSLCQEYHPDKLPLGTPEKACKHIEEKFKQINEAFSTLSDPESRRKYDSFLSRNAQSSTEQSSANYRTNDIFDPEKLKRTAERLKKLEKKIDMNHKKIKEGLCKSAKKELNALGYNEEDLAGDTLSTKIIICFLSVLFGFVGFWLMSLGAILWLVGIALIGFCGLVILGAVFSPRLTTKSYEEIKPIKEKLDAGKLNAKTKRDRQLNAIKEHRQKRIEFFKSIQTQEFSNDYIASLSDVDQLYLLQAIQERQDGDETDQNLKNVARVAVGVSILAVMFGLGIS